MAGQEPPPIFFVGAPRSGTTITFERFADHADLAWVSNYSKVFPRWPMVNYLRRAFDNRLLQAKGQKNQFNDASWINNYLPRPDESYPFWNAYACEGFDRRYLLGEQATAEERNGLYSALGKVRRFQGRKRVTAKMTGPGRLAYLQSVWPDMYVIHVVRDGLDVVRSLLNVNFWKRQGGYEKLWWEGGGLDEDFARWQAEGCEPGALAALQWRRIAETTRDEGRALLGDRYIEIRYEDFLADSPSTLKDLYDRVELAQPDRPIQPMQARNKSYSDPWSDEYQRSLTEWMQPIYGSMGYSIPSAAESTNT